MLQSSLCCSKRDVFFSSGPATFHRMEFTHIWTTLPFPSHRPEIALSWVRYTLTLAVEKALFSPEQQVLKNGICHVLANVLVYIFSIFLGPWFFLYEGWNFNFGNAAVTFDTTHLQSSYFHKPSMYSPKLCRTRSQRWGRRMMPLAAPVLLMVRTERSTAEGLNPLATVLYGNAAVPQDSSSPR